MFRLANVLEHRQVAFLPVFVDGHECVAAAIRVSGLRCEAINLFLADGAAAGQEVFHSHLHVIPRWQGDGFGIKFPPHYGAAADRKTLDDIAARLRKQIS